MSRYLFALAAALTSMAFTPASPAVDALSIKLPASRVRLTSRTKSASRNRKKMIAASKRINRRK